MITPSCKPGAVTRTLMAGVSGIARLPWYRRDGERATRVIHWK
jgi:hypothetical protein